MDLSDYELGVWISELGKYKKKCKMQHCKREFAGRDNQFFCTEKCKSKHNNDKQKYRRSLAKRYNNLILKANVIFHDLIDDWDSINIISKQDLFRKGYTEYAPGRQAKYNIYHGEWWCIGSFAHRISKDDENIIEFIYSENLN
jgi:hypothetical protein